MSEHPTTVSRFGVPDLGIGVGYRTPHYRHVAENRPPMDWFEIVSENFMVDGGAPLFWLEHLIDGYPVIPHGVAMSIAGEEDPEHTARLRTLLDATDPPWFSDHLCFTGTTGRIAHDLLPVPYTKDVAQHIIDRIRRLQDDTGRLFAVENVSSYLTYKASRQQEWDFLAHVVEQADCGLLLDVNNVFVSSVNHGFDPTTYLDHVPSDRVVQFHLAGHTIADGYRIDTHDGPVCDEVWALYRHMIRRTGSISTLIEWDASIPSFERLSREAERARAARDEALIDA